MRLTISSRAAKSVLLGRDLTMKPADASDLRRFLEVKPVLDFADPQPGPMHHELIRETARTWD